MNSTIKRLIGASCAAAVVAGAALMTAPAAQANGGNSGAAIKPAQVYGAFYGTWNLAAWELDGQIINCPGKLPLPAPAPTIECTGGETLKLRSNNTYKSTLDVIRMESHGGEFEVIKFPMNKYRTIVFQSFEVLDDPSPYQVKLQGKTSAGTYTKLVVSTHISTGPGVKIPISMIFRRDAT